MNPSNIAIETLLPHADNMVFLNRLLSCDEDKAQAELIVKNDHLFQGAPETMPAWVGIEYMAQAIAAWAGFQALSNNEPVKIGFLVGARKYTSNTPHFKKDDVLLIDIARVFHDETGLASFDCRISDKFDKIAVEAVINVFQPDDERLKEMMES